MHQIFKGPIPYKARTALVIIIIIKMILTRQEDSVVMCWETKDMAIIFSTFSYIGFSLFIWVAILQNINVLLKKKKC